MSRSPAGRAVLCAGTLLLSCTVLCAPSTAVPTESAAQLIDKLGLRIAPQPVRERAGWHSPRVVIVGDDLAELVPQLQSAAPHARLVLAKNAGRRDLAAAEASLGVCTSELLTQAKQLQWIQWPAAGVERCVQQPQLHERHLLLTNLQRTMGPSMAEHVIALMLALSRHLAYFEHEQQQAHWVDWDSAPQLKDLDGATVLVVGLG